MYVLIKTCDCVYLILHYNVNHHLPVDDDGDDAEIPPLPGRVVGLWLGYEFSTHKWVYAPYHSKHSSNIVFILTVYWNSHLWWSCHLRRDLHHGRKENWNVEFPFVHQLVKGYNSCCCCDLSLFIITSNIMSYVVSLCQVSHRDRFLLLWGGHILLLLYESQQPWPTLLFSIVLLCCYHVSMLYWIL